MVDTNFSGKQNFEKRTHMHVNQEHNVQIFTYAPV